MTTFDPSRLTTARELAGLNKSKAAAGIVSGASLTRYEKGEQVPSADIAEQLAARLNVHSSFFFAADPLPDAGPCFFRRKSKTPKYVIRRYEARAQLLGAAQDVVGAPISEVPRMRSDHVEVVAAAVRTMLGLQMDQPIKSMADVAERFGVWIATLPPDHDTLVDAFCTDVSGRSLIFANCAGSDAFRRRFNLAHELMHLIRDEEPADGREAIKAQEQEAHRFAAELLLPTEVWKDICPMKGLTNPFTYIRYQAKYGISVKALMYRTRKLGLLSDSEYRYGMMRYSKNGWNQGEPESPDSITRLGGDEPRLPRHQLQAASATIHDVAAELHCTPELAAELFSVPVPRAPQRSWTPVVLEGGKR